ncbi:MAG: GMC family oxidoreductase [Devosia sp.]|nr:GMC family oxidoreductase [Devosia sp.]
MIEDAETLGDDRFAKTYDACIIGSGPAGVTLARRLGARGLSVALCEGGGLKLTTASQTLYEGKVVGQPYYALDAARLRYFGGSSNHWGGWTHTLDPYDFAPSANNPLSGWPIRANDLVPYAAEADDILDLPADREPPDMFPKGQDRLVPRFFRFSRPITRFGEKYGPELAASKTVDVFYNANLIDMRLGPDGHTVAEAQFQSYQRPGRFAIKARTFALCLGGLENPRALLNMTSDRPAGLGNENDLVGRYFMEHLHAEIGEVVFRKPLDWLLVYAPSQQLMGEKQILNFGLRVGDEDQWNGGDFTGEMKPQPPCGVDFDAVLDAAMRGHPAPCPGLVGDAFIVAEQSLNPNNRVKLGTAKDRFGWRPMELDWSLSDTDYRTIKTCALETGRLMALYDVGRLKIVDWLLKGATPTLDQLAGGNHHMGTTRMSADPRTGVVDGNCKVHSLANLYIGGSSVFATSGHANPTYTITQLALRLGDHLIGRLTTA